MIRTPAAAHETVRDSYDSFPGTELVKQVYEQWDVIAKKPGEWLQDMTGEIAFTAGGGLTTLFGKEDSQIWKDIQKASSNGEISIAGITFSIAGLQLMGDFYRFLRGSLDGLQCIDERLQDSSDSKGKEVHEHCGACGAVHGAIQQVTGIHDMEDQALRELGQVSLGKQEIYKEMPNHKSLTILVDLHGDDAVIDEKKRRQLMAVNALPFQVSLPVEKIQEFIAKPRRGSNNGLDRVEIDLLLTTLVNWNVRIARNIIGGNHNDLHARADQTLIVIDTRNVAQGDLVAQLRQLIDQSVQHNKILLIR